MFYIFYVRDMALRLQFTLIKYESYSLCKGSSRKKHLLMQYIKKTYESFVETKIIFMNVLMSTNIME